MNFLFLNGLYPQYSQTFVDDQIRSISRLSMGHVVVFARSKTKFRFEAGSADYTDQMLYARPADTRSLKRLLGSIFRRPSRAITALVLYCRGKISYPSLYLAVTLPAPPNVIVTHFGSNYRIGVALKKHFFPEARNVVVFHGHDISSYIVKNGWAHYRAAAPHIDLAVCVNRVWADKLRDATEIRDIKTIYLGTSAPTPVLGKLCSDEAFNILFVGRFTEKKGFDDLAAAIHTLTETTSAQIRVHCVGDGPDLERHQQLALQSNSGQFIFYGAKPKEFVNDILQRCDLLVVPSKTAQNGDSEGLPIVILEAMRRKLPVLGTRHSGIPEVIKNEETGILVDEASPDALASAINECLSNAKKLNGIAERALAHATKYHDQRRQTEEFIRAIS